MGVTKHSITGIPDDFYIKTINEEQIPSVAGETAYWYCDPCGDWKHATIEIDGIQCPTCGTYADVTDKNKLPLLSFESRLNRVQKLCAEGGEWDTTYLNLVDNYADCIDEMHRGKMPKHPKQTCFGFFRSVWREVDGLADYILTAKDVTVANVARAYTERGLRKHYYKADRKYNTCNYCDLNLTAPDADDEEDNNYTQAELVESASFQNGYSQPFYDDYFSLDDFCTGITDVQDKEIVKRLYQGYTKTEVARDLGLSIQNLRTRIKHIAVATKKNI